MEIRNSQFVFKLQRLQRKKKCAADLDIWTHNSSWYVWIKGYTKRKTMKIKKLNFIKNTWQIIEQKLRESAGKRKNMWVLRNNVKMKTFY